MVNIIKRIIIMHVKCLIYWCHTCQGGGSFEVGPYTIAIYTNVYGSIEEFPVFALTLEYLMENVLSVSNGKSYGYRCSGQRRYTDSIQSPRSSAVVISYKAGTTFKIGNRGFCLLRSNRLSLCGMRICP